MNCIPPRTEFPAKACAHLCDEFGALLIIDEVMTGFTRRAGGRPVLLRRGPDLTCLGGHRRRYAGGALSAVAARSWTRWRRPVRYTGRRYAVRQPCRAAGRRLRLLKQVAQPGVHETLTELTNQLADGLLNAARKPGSAGGE